MPGGQEEIRLQPDTSNCPPLVVVADDLTGACDAAVAFTRIRGLVRLQIFGDANESSGIRALTTESRDLPAREAELRLRNIIEQLPEDTEVSKKIDSVFRGNTSHEVAVVLDCARFDLAVIAPAYPALGRTVRDGVLEVRDVTGARTIPIADLLREAGCPLAIVPVGESADELAASLRQRVGREKAAILCDASTDADLRRIVRAARSLEKRILWIGSGGLAHALAEDLPAQAARPMAQVRSGATIFFVGSTHTVSVAQADHLRRVAKVAEHDRHRSSASAEDLLVTVDLGNATQEDIRHAAASHDPSQTACLFMTGGDTAHFVCRALGIRALCVLHEFAPGVPVAIAEGGPFDGVRVVLKSGGFGEPELLCRLLETNRARIEVTA